MGFTTYLDALDPSGDPPDRASFDAVWGLLRRALVHEMKRRGLWSAPPRYLGVVGASHWGEDALEELLADCYAAIFIRRLPGLLKRRSSGQNVDSLVFRNVRNFLHDRQRKQDPLGFRVFAIYREAIERRLAAEELYRLEGEASIRNDTVLGFALWSAPPPAEADFEPTVRAWHDELLPDLIVARGRARQGVIERLGERIGELAAAGVESFRFRQLIDPAKGDVRARWRELMPAVREVLPAADDLWGLHGCVATELEKIECPEKTRSYLQKLWRFFYSYAVDAAVDAAQADTGAGGKEPSLTPFGLGKHLGIPRERISELRRALGSLVEGCQTAAGAAGAAARPAASAASGAAPSSWGAVAEAGGSENRELLRTGADAAGAEERRESLRARTGRAAAGIAAKRAALDRDREGPPRPGDVYRLAETDPLAVEWLVLDSDREGNGFLVVAVDDDPAIGSADLRVAVDDDLGIAVIVRCAVDGSVDAEMLGPASRVDALSPETLESVRRKRAEVEAGEVTGPVLEREVDDDPEYRARIEEIRRASAAILRRRASVHAPPLAPVVEHPAARRWGGAKNLLALAASLLLMLSIWQGWRIADLERGLGEPRLNPPVIWVEPWDPSRGEVEPIVIRAGAEWLTLVVDVPVVETYHRYRLEILERESGEEIWSSDRLSLEKNGLSLGLPRSFVVSGSYLLRVYGLADAEPRPEEPLLESVLRLELE